MSFFRFCLFVVSTLAVSLPAVGQEVVVQDGEVTLTDEELTYKIGRWTAQMKEAAIADEGDRLELLNVVLANKKVALEAERLVKDRPDLYWGYVDGMEKYQRNFVLVHQQAALDMPDFTDLAKERYTVEKDKYALIPEKRQSSHILFSSPPGLPRDDVMVKAQKVLDELRAGADFVEMVKQYSQEPGAAKKEGKFSLWMTAHEKRVAPPYREALFGIEKVGDYAELTGTQFGVHIIRLDGIEEHSYKSFDEVKGDIVAELQNEYIRLAMKDFLSRFHMSEDVIIDNEAVMEILVPDDTQE